MKKVIHHHDRRQYKSQQTITTNSLRSAILKQSKNPISTSNLKQSKNNTTEVNGNPNNFLLYLRIFASGHTIELPYMYYSKYSDSLGFSIM